jgi:putative ABC transport system permease protein
MNWKQQVQQAFAPHVLDDDVVEELAQHADATYSAGRAEGLLPDEAARRVQAQIRAWASNPSLLERRPRRPPAVEPPPGSASPLSAIFQDARYALRLLRRQPAYAALVVVTMALGIAATTVLGSVAYGVLLKPLPWADAPRLVRLYESRQGGNGRFGSTMTNLSYRAWAESSQTLDTMGAWTTEQVSLADQARAARISITAVTPSLLPMLGAKPIAGRLFTPGEEEPGRPSIIILSYGLWQQQFAGRPDVVGQRLRLDATTYTVIGVMADAFAFPDRDTRAWVPFYVEPVNTPGSKSFSISMFQAIGRLRGGATPDQASSEGTARGRSVPDPGVVAMAVFGSNGPAEVTATPLLDSLVRDVKPAIVILFVAVVLLLATAIANIASLQLARATGRRRELAVRAAIGAGRGRLVRQTLVENIVLGLFGGIAGAILAALIHRALPSVLPANFPRLGDVAFGWRIELFAAAVSIVAGLACGVLPALQVARTDLVPALAEDALAPVGGGLRTRTARARAAIMAAQVAIACVLLVGAALLVRSFVDLMNANLGYDATNLLTARIVMADGEYSPERRLTILDAMAARLKATPGVMRVAFSNAIPFTSGESLSSFPVMRRDGSSVQVQTGVRQVSIDYFGALGQRIAEGRGFTGDDENAAQMPVIVNREFSRKYLDGRALGWGLPVQLKPGVRLNTGRPIVGVVDDTVRRDVTDAPLPEVYYTVSHRPDAGSQQQLRGASMMIIIRTSGDPLALIPTLRDIAQNAAPAAPLESVMTMRDRVGVSLAKPRLYAILLGTFAVFALAIAAVGLFGVLSYSVAQRAREIGVRAALGAQVRDIVSLVLRQSMAIALTGVAGGIIASFWIAKALQQFLYGVTSHDAVSFALVAGVLLLAAAIATIVPAKRAASVDPVSVLRR